MNDTSLMMNHVMHNEPDLQTFAYYLSNKTAPPVAALYKMKNKLRMIFLLSVFSLAATLSTQKTAAQSVRVDFQVFYDELSPYGTWIDNPEYGYVWMPRVGRDFTPYGSNGYWIFTDEGWTWVSNYSWGWAPFHYGRWFYDDYYGAMWVPGDEWGPGWVSWRRSEGYYGWAPIGPGVSISVAYGNSYNIPYNHWRFVRDRDFGRTNINNYYVSTTNNTTIINNSVVINNEHRDRQRNVLYNAGPERTEVERRSGRSFKAVSIRESSRPGQRLNKQQLQIYRPQVRVNIEGSRKPAPGKVMNMKGGRLSGSQINNNRNPQGNPSRDLKPLNKNDRGRQEKGMPAQNRQQPRQQNQPSRQTNPSNRNQQGPRQEQRKQEREQPRQRQEQPRQNQRPQETQRQEREQPRQRQEQPRPNQRPQETKRQEREQPRQRQEQPRPNERPQEPRRQEREQPRQNQRQQEPSRPQQEQRRNEAPRNQGNSQQQPPRPVRQQEPRPAPHEQRAPQQNNQKQENHERGGKEDKHDK